MKEYILCAAIWYEDLESQRFLPVNITNGIVVCGLRHAHCIDIMFTVAELRTVRLSPDGVGKNTQGFLTNLNRFVTREEAAKIAFEAGQIQKEKKKLFSEDLY